jgi:hypothetical protein
MFLYSSKRLLVLLLCMYLGACSSPRYTKHYVSANVLNIKKSDLICGSRSSSNSPSLLTTLLLTTVGGVIGNQFGGGSGKIAATIIGAGAGLGIAAASSSDGVAASDGQYNCRENGFSALVQYRHPNTNVVMTDNVTLSQNVGKRRIQIPVYIPVPLKKED